VTKAEHLTEEQRTAACLMYLFAFWHYDETRDGRWYMHVIQRSWRPGVEKTLAGCVWWAIRFENESADPDWIGYLEHVCRNRGVLAR